MYHLALVHSEQYPVNLKEQECEDLISIVCLVKRRAYLPASLNAIEVPGEGASEKPHLREAELTGHLDTGTPNIYGCLCSIVSITLHVPNCMLPIVSRNIVLVQSAVTLNSITSSLT